MKRLIIALVILGVGLLSTQGAYAQNLGKQKQKEYREQQKQESKKLTKGTRVTRKDIVADRARIRQIKRDIRQDRKAYRALNRAGHPVMAKATKRHIRHDKAALRMSHRHLKNDLRHLHRNSN